MELPIRSYMILTAGRGISGQELGERRSEAQVTYACGDESPQNRCRATRGKGQGERCGQGSPRVQDGKGHTQHRQCGEVAGELCGMPESGELGIVGETLLPTSGATHVCTVP